ncbi:MAG TPA: tetratricopeptide repeat protein, partial [Bacteroidia bacterium]|nr:tetratricopeptide repeat protein [Bacteroidia bacterium]
MRYLLAYLAGLNAFILTNRIGLYLHSGMFYKKHFINKNFGTMLFLWVMLVPFLSVSQSKIDSLKTAVSKAKTDTAKISALNNLASALAIPDSISSAIRYSGQAVSLSKSIRSDKKLAESMLNAAIIFWTIGQTDSAMNYTKQPIAFYEKEGASKMLVKTYRTTGGIYRDKLQYKEANEFLLKALGMAQKLKDSTDVGSINLSLGKLCQANSEFNLAITYFKTAMDIDMATKQYKPAVNAANYLASVYAKEGISAMGAEIYFEALEINSKYLKDANITAIINVNLGNLYSEKGDTANAIKYYQASYTIFKNMNSKKNMAQLLGDIGNVYMNEGNYKKAETYELESMQEIIAEGDKENITLCYTNVAEFYTHTKDYEKALKYYNMAIPLQEEMDDKEGLAYTFSGLADLCINNGDLAKAEEYGVKSYNIATEIHLERQVRDVAKTLSGLFDKLHQPDKAFFYYKKFIEARDTLENKEE